MNSKLIIFIKTIILLTFLMLSVNTYAEYIFLKDGSIIKGAILKDTDKVVVLKLENGKKRRISRKKILRTIYKELYQKKVFIYKMDGSVIEAFQVAEDRNNYICRNLLDSPNEFLIPKKDVQFISMKKVKPKVIIKKIYIEKKVYINKEKEKETPKKKKKWQRQVDHTIRGTRDNLFIMWGSINALDSEYDMKLSESNLDPITAKGYSRNFYSIHFEYFPRSFAGLGLELFYNERDGEIFDWNSSSENFFNFTKGSSFYGGNFLIYFHPLREFIVDVFAGAGLSAGLLETGATETTASRWGYGYVLSFGINLFILPRLFVGSTYNIYKHKFTFGKSSDISRYPEFSSSSKNMSIHVGFGF